MRCHWDLLEVLRWFWTAVMLGAACVLFFYFHLEALAILVVMREMIALAILNIEREWEDFYDDAE